MRQQQAAGGEQITVPLYQETVKIGKREVDAGGVRIRKEVKTETMKEPLQLRQETLTFERLPAEAQDSSGKKAAAAPQGSQLGTPFQPGEVVIRLHKEEPMVDRQMTQSGRIVAQKGSNTQEVTVKEDVRREQVDIEKLGNPENVTIPENLQSPGAVGGTPTTGGEQTGAGSSGQKAGK
jgi:stress response protein YsnF